MDMTFSAEDEAFREEVRTFIAENLPLEIQEASRRSPSYVPKEYTKRWHKILFEKGWVAPSWPKEHGGCEWTPVQKHIYDEEYQNANAPRLSSFGITMIGPVLYTFGTKDQKQQHIPSILNGDIFWCQGYSEPGSGSDLASLQTRAELDESGDNYIVNGQKIWTSHAHHADWIFALVRTSSEGKKQEGISFLLIDMSTPGLEVKPIISMDGGHYLNEVFFVDVKVPVHNRIGEEDMGWTYAKYLLGHERTGIAGVAKSKRKLKNLKEIAGLEQLGDKAMIDDQDFKSRVASVGIKLQALEITNLRTLAAVNVGKSPGDASSILKIRGTEIEQELNELLIEAMGYYAHPYQPGRLFNQQTNMIPVGPDHAVGLMEEHLLRRAASIYGGSNEIQKNIIAKAIMGL
ncbi:MAG: pimeloyl-CoA dehydrogenase large subunit [Rhodospirillaceae bacterium]|nr:pimeloyl-CoA dehydrogenase large subunit [Rhodospirillaceae bacterium]|tara:strand:- start:850 stop:2058 length:1209 start_codon:yes stop_codon:yes gene_type:complete